MFDGSIKIDEKSKSRSEPQKGRKPIHESGPPHISNPKDGSEPLQERKPFRYSEPLADRKPMIRSEPIKGRKPYVESEPKSCRKPTLKSEPKGEREPQGQREPSPVRKPQRASEPVKDRKPFVESEPKASIKPLLGSEPISGRKPSSESEPCEGRNPIGISEPLQVRTPEVESESSKVRKPETQSEPKSLRKPSKLSEPISGRKPSSESEPIKRRKPRKVSEPMPERKPSSLSDLNRSRIRQLVEVYYDTQEVRIRSFNRLRQVGSIEGVNPNRLVGLENEIKKTIKNELKGDPIYELFLKKVKGIGPILSGGILAYLDPAKANHISSFWKYCGLHVVDGKAVRAAKGKKLDFPPKLRVLMWRIAKSFVMSRSPVYREIYDSAKVEENAKLNNPVKNPKNCPDYKSCAERMKSKKTRPACKLHIDYRAKRKMIKRFLADLWLEWRKLEGLPISEPYAVGVLGHDREAV